MALLYIDQLTSISYRSFFLGVFQFFEIWGECVTLTTLSHIYKFWGHICSVKAAWHSSCQFFLPSFLKWNIFILPIRDFHFANYRFYFTNIITDFHFTNCRFSFAKLIQILHSTDNFIFQITVVIVGPLDLTPWSLILDNTTQK